MTESWKTRGFDDFMTDTPPIPLKPFKSDASELPATLSGGGWKGNFVITDGYLQSQDFVTGTSGWRIDADGDVEFSSGTFRGSITSTSGTIGGWTIGSTSLSSTGMNLSSSDGIQLMVSGTQRGRIYQVTDSMVLSTIHTSIAKGIVLYRPNADNFYLAPEAGANNYVGLDAVRWTDGFFTDLHVTNDVTVGDIIFKDKFRITEETKNGIDRLSFYTTKGKHLVSFTADGNILFKKEIKKLK